MCIYAPRPRLQTSGLGTWVCNLGHAGDPGMMWSHMEYNIRKVLDKVCPLKQLIVSEHKPDWLNDEIIHLMKRRDREAHHKKAATLWRKK